jgi:hypothetical protein
MGKDRQGPATGRSRSHGPGRPDRQAKKPNREQLAARRVAQEAARRRAARRRLVVPLIAVGLVVAVVVGLVVASVTSGGATASEVAAPTNVVAKATNVPGGVLAQVGTGQAATALQPASGGSPLAIDSKLGIVFVSEESCPFCAAERWPVVIALSHFGTWSHLGATSSSSTDVYPNTATFSFRDATYSSPYLSLRTTELADNAGHQLQAPTALDTGLINRYDVPPYVNSADQSGSVPFLDIGNRFILAGAQYNPQVLASLSMSQIAEQLGDPASPIARAIDQSANALIVAIDQLLPAGAGHG